VASVRSDAGVGVLVVHGIGEQRREATLTELDDALACGLRRWLGADRVGVSRHAAADPDPAYAHVRIDAGRGESAGALVAEGWWAAEVAADRRAVRRPARARRGPAAHQHADGRRAALAPGSASDEFVGRWPSTHQMTAAGTPRPSERSPAP